MLIQFKQVLWGVYAMTSWNVLVVCSFSGV